jgi:hypothetical protein
MGNGSGGIAGAKLSIPYMGMGDILSTGWRMGIQSYNVKRRDIGPAHPIQMKLDPEGAEIDALQFNGIGGHRHGAGVQIHGYLREFLLQMNQFLVQITNSRFEGGWVYNWNDRFRYGRSKLLEAVGDTFFHDRR